MRKSCCVAVLLMILLPAIAWAGSYKELVPGVSSRSDVEAVLGKPIREIQAGRYYAYPAEGHDLESLLVKYDETGLVTSIQLKFPQAYALSQVQKWFDLERPDKSEVDFHGFRNDTYRERGIVLHFDGAGEDGQVAGLSHVPTRVKPSPTPATASAPSKAPAPGKKTVVAKPVAKVEAKPGFPEETNWLGALLAPGLANRVEVLRPISGSPADKAGLSPGDVITRIGAVDLSGKGSAAMAKAVQNLPAGKPLPLAVTRMGKNIRLDVTLARKTPTEISALRNSQKSQAKLSYDRGRKLKDQRRYAEAIPHYLTALRLDPEKNDHYDDLAICLRETRKRQEAYKLLRASMMLRETYFNTYHYGYMLFEEQKERAAVAYFERSASLIGSGSTWHWPYLRLGQAHYNLKEYTKAKAALKQAEKLKPQDADVLYYLFYCCDHLGQAQEALDYGNRYLALNTRDSERNARIRQKMPPSNKTAGSNGHQGNLMDGFSQAIDAVAKDIKAFNED